MSGPPPPIPRRISEGGASGLPSSTKSVRPLPPVPPTSTSEPALPPKPPKAVAYRQSRNPTDVYIETGTGSPAVRPQSSIDQQPMEGRLEEAEWYWGNVTREEVIDIMKSYPDGSYLVRDSARVPGEYTLTLKKGGVNRLIRIIHRDGKYGFSEPLQFPSVVNLINYYKHHSLEPYSHKLNTKLLSPVSREEEDSEVSSTDEIVSNLVEAELKYKELTNKYQDLYDRWTLFQKDINSTREMIESEKQILTMVEAQLEIQASNANRIGAGEIPIWKENTETCKRRAMGHREAVEVKERDLAKLERDSKEIDVSMQGLKPQIMKLTERKNYYYKMLLHQNYTPEAITQLLSERTEPLTQYEDPHDIYAFLHTEHSREQYDSILRKMESRPPPMYPTVPRTPRASIIKEDSVDMTCLDNLPHRSSNYWLSSSINRERSRSLLSTKPNGTFLVRPKERPEIVDPDKRIMHTHTIDVMDANHFKRIAVLRDPKGGYGFAEPLEFPSLEHLICYYATHSLQKHNPDLKTTLVRPAFL